MFILTVRKILINQNYISCSLETLRILYLLSNLEFESFSKVVQLVVTLGISNPYRETRSDISEISSNLFSFPLFSLFLHRQHLSLPHLHSSPTRGGSHRRSITTLLSCISSFRFSRWKLHQHSFGFAKTASLFVEQLHKRFFFIKQSSVYVSLGKNTRFSQKWDTKYQICMGIVRNIKFNILYTSI